MGWTENDLTNYIARLNRLKQEDAQKRANNGIVRALKKQRHKRPIAKHQSVCGAEMESKTEARYFRDILKCSRATIAQPPPLFITDTRKRKYTEDFLTEAEDSTGTHKIYHEVKGAYRLGSHGRARLAWEIAAERNPECEFRWATLKKRNGKFAWEIEVWQNGGRLTGRVDDYGEVVMKETPRNAPKTARERSERKD